MEVYPNEQKSEAPDARKVSTGAVSSAVVENPEPGRIAPRQAERAFNPDYTPVIKDLKRIGVLAGTFFVVLIALSFILK